MRMSFSGLQIALSGLNTSQKALSISSHNITNAATPGYTKQVGQIVTNVPQSAYGSGMIGTGSDMVAINSVRDSYVNYRYWSENTNVGEWDIKETSLSNLEMIFNEMGNSGLTTVLNDFYSSLQELSKDPSSLPARVAFKEKAISVTKHFNNMASELSSLQRDYNFGIKSKVDEINSYSQQIRDLNEQIYKIEITGTSANDLRDKRQVLVDNLSKIVNIDVTENSVGTLSNGLQDKRFVIKINGHILVNHIDNTKVTYTQRTAAEKQNPDDIDGLYKLTWEDGNNFNFEGGELKGYMDMRDGNGSGLTGSNNPYKGIPYYAERLNNFVRTFAKSINEGTGSSSGFEKGYDLDGLTGIKLFTTDKLSSASFTDYSTMSAQNINISADILAGDGIRRIPASDTLNQTGNSRILASVLEARHNSTLFSEGSPEDYIKSLVATLGVDSQEANKMSELQQSVVRNLENKRESVSGVNIDEEMANVVKYQQIYAASAKLISIMNDLYSITINNLGLAGR